MSEMDLETRPQAPAKKAQQKIELPWDSIDPDEPMTLAATAAARVVRRALPVSFAQTAAAPAKKPGPFASNKIVATGAEMVQLSAEIQSLLAEHQHKPAREGTGETAEKSGDHLLAKARLTDEKVELIDESVVEAADSFPAQAEPVDEPLVGSTVIVPVEVEQTPWETIDEVWEDDEAEEVVMASVDTDVAPEVEIADEVPPVPSPAESAVAVLEKPLATTIAVPQESEILQAEPAAAIAVDVVDDVAPSEEANAALVEEELNVGRALPAVEPLDGTYPPGAEHDTPDRSAPQTETVRSADPTVLADDRLVTVVPSPAEHASADVDEPQVLESVGSALLTEDSERDDLLGAANLGEIASHGEVPQLPSPAESVIAPAEEPPVGALAALVVPDASSAIGEPLRPVASDTISAEKKHDLVADDAIDAELAGQVMEEPAVDAADVVVTAPVHSTSVMVMTAPVAPDVSPSADYVASVEPEESHDLADERILTVDIGAAEYIAAIGEPVALAEVEALKKAELETDLAHAGSTGAGWTIPLMCLGIGLIACCMAIPQIEVNRRLRYEQSNLRANLESVEKQVSVNSEFLKKVMDDPTLAERLADRQLKTIPQGQRVVASAHNADDGDMSPFALVAVAPPPKPAPYAPVRGSIADLCNNPHSRLYVLGAAMTMVAVGLVMGCGVTGQRRV